MKKKTISPSKFERVSSHLKAECKSVYITEDSTKCVISFYWRDSGGVFLYAHVLEMKRNIDLSESLNESMVQNEYWCRVDMRTMF